MKKLAALILAAGYSRRFGADNKLFAIVEGNPLLSHVIEHVYQQPFAQCIIVTNEDDQQIQAQISDDRLKIVIAPDASKGMGHSIAAGIASLDDVDGVMVILGDMPFIRTQTYAALIETFQRSAPDCIIVPYFEEQRGHPVIFSKDYFNALRTLSGDSGAANLIERHAKSLQAVSVGDAGIHRDIDLPTDL